MMRRPHSDEELEMKSLEVNQQEGDEGAAVRGENPSRTSKLPAVVLLVLVGLLAAALIVIYRLSFDKIQTNQTLQTLKEENEALRRNMSEIEPGSKSFTATCPTSPACPACPTCPACPPPPHVTEIRCENKSSTPAFPTCPTCPTCPPPTTEQKETFLKCEAGWEPHGGNCYYFSIIRPSWTQSRHSCIDQGSDLVKIDSREEQTFLDKRLRGLMEDDEDKFWIGLTDSVQEGRWFWVDGSALDRSLTFWNNTEPDDWEGGEDCVRMGHKNGHLDLRCWFDAACYHTNRYICEKAARSSFLCV